MRKSRGLENLPPEILFQILCCLPDIECLDSVIRASPNAWRVFDTFAVEIADQVLDNRYTHGYTRSAIRMVSYIRQGCFPINTVLEFQRRISRVVTVHSGYQDNTSWVKPCEDPFAPTTLPSGSTSSSVRSILATARRIRSLTLECINYYLARFRALKPQVPVQPDYHPHTPTCVVHVNADDPPKEPYNLQDVGAPKWIEDQYVYLAFWRVQCIRDLQRALKEGIINDWDECEGKRLCDMDLFELYNFQEIEEEIQSRCELAEHGLIMSILYFLEQLPRPHQPVEPPSRVILKPSPQDEEDFESCWTTGPSIWESIYLAFQDLDPEHKSFTPFRRLGFAIWTDDRLAAYGLSQTGGGDRELHSYLIAWLSVLTPEELTHLEQMELDG